MILIKWPLWNTIYFCLTLLNQFCPSSPPSADKQIWFLFTPEFLNLSYFSFAVRTFWYRFTTGIHFFGYKCQVVVYCYWYFHYSEKKIIRGWGNSSFSSRTLALVVMHVTAFSRVAWWCLSDVVRLLLKSLDGLWWPSLRKPACRNFDVTLRCFFANKKSLIQIGDRFTTAGAKLGNS